MLPQEDSGELSYVTVIQQPWTANLMDFAVGRAHAWFTGMWVEVTWHQHCLATCPQVSCTPRAPEPHALCMRGHDLWWIQVDRWEYSHWTQACPGGGACTHFVHKHELTYTCAHPVMNTGACNAHVADVFVCLWPVAWQFLMMGNSVEGWWPVP